MSDSISLPGCRHDILGHYLKAIGILRVLAKCAAPEHRDPDAEGWWNPDDAIFYLRSSKYPTVEALVEFFEKHYQPTPVFSPWNTGGGMDEKKIIIFRCAPKPWHDYWHANKAALLAHGFSKPEGDEVPDMPEKGFELKLPQCELKPTDDIDISITVGKQKKPKTTIQISWSRGAKARLFDSLVRQLPFLKESIKFRKREQILFAEPNPDKPEFVFDLIDENIALQVKNQPFVQALISTKESGDKAVFARLSDVFSTHPDAQQSLALGRRMFDDFQEGNSNTTELLERFRNDLAGNISEALDAIYSSRVTTQKSNNPLFLNRGKGEGGNDEMFRMFWVHYEAFTSKDRAALAQNSIQAKRFQGKIPTIGLGYPFFSDAIKAFNVGSSWDEGDYPFNSLDYILAIEGAFAMRGSVSRALASNSRRFAAFPFVFEAGEEMTGEKNDIKGVNSSLWLPLWRRRTTFGELASFIADAQTRLPGKEARFSAEFVRALNSQGVDAGFTGWQEFRFKLKGSRVPWITTGRYISASHRRTAIQLNIALRPLDERRFIDQFQTKTGQFEKGGPHLLRAEINAAMEAAALDPTAHHCMALLESIFKASRQLVTLKSSKSLRDKLQGSGTFFDKLPASEWSELLRDLESLSEFRIARAIASISGLQRQQDPKPRSEVQPLLGSLLPLTLEKWGWHLPLPPQEKPSNQAVWTGSDLCHDLSAILQRRYMDSLKDDQPALRGVHHAQLADVMAFLNHELDDHLIARWVEALSLIGWHFEKPEVVAQREIEVAQAAADEAPFDLADDNELKAPPAIPLAYAALRTLLELECQWQGDNRSTWKKRRSQQPIFLLCQRSASSLPVAVSEALRWIGIWGVHNPWGAKSCQEKEILSGRYIVRLDHRDLNFAGSLVDPSRLAAAVCIPLAWEDQWQLRRAITLPFSA